MNQKQAITRDFIELVLLEPLSADEFENLQQIVSAEIFNQGDEVSAFCRFFEIEDLAQTLDNIEFPFLNWWNEYCHAYEQELQENARESAELMDDYYRMVGAK